MHPTAAISASESSLALVNEFCSRRPISSPRRLAAVRSAITTIAPIRSPDRPTPPAPNHTRDPINGHITPRNRAKATATAAIVPVWITSKSVHPNRNAHIPPYASRRYTYCPPACGIIAASSP